jgi:FtsH-binding integral membrane protein
MMNPFELARRYWRFLAPTWLTPVVFMLLIVAQDVSGAQLFRSPWPLLIVMPVMLAGTLAAGFMQRREHLPWGVFYLIWLAPMMAVWCSLVFVRAAILITLGRPL